MMNQDYKGELSNLIAVLGMPTTLAVIVSVTTDCVLSCRYCFAKSSGCSGVLDEAMLEPIIRDAFDTRHDNVSFEWTGGEPLLAGKSFYARVIELQKRLSTKGYVNYIQTSGALHDFELMDFLVQNGFRLSVTIDGPPDLHDAHRPLSSGKGSYYRVMESYERISSLQGRCGFISTISKLSSGREADMLAHFRRLNAESFHSNPYIYDAGKDVHCQSIALRDMDYAAYLIGQFGAWLGEGQIRPIPVVLDLLLGGIARRSRPSSPLCTFSGRCLGNFVAIDPNGYVYPCPKLMGYPQSQLGRIGEFPVWSIMSIDNPRMRKLVVQRAVAIASCKKDDCKYQWLCNSGCPYRSFVASGHQDISARDPLCPSILAVAEFLESAVECLAPYQQTVSTSPATAS